MAKDLNAKLTKLTPAEHEVLTEMYEERAAIMEHDGGLPRAEAEKRAKELVRVWANARRAAGKPIA